MAVASVAPAPIAGVRASTAIDDAQYFMKHWSINSSPECHGGQREKNQAETDQHQMADGAIRGGMIGKERPC